MRLVRCNGAQDMAVHTQGGTPAEKFHHWANALLGARLMDLAKSPTGIHGLGELTGERQIAPSLAKAGVLPEGLGPRKPERGAHGGTE